MFSIFHRALKSAILHRVAAANRTLTLAFRWEIFAIELSQRQLFIQKIQLQAQCFFSIKWRFQYFHLFMAHRSWPFDMKRLQLEQLQDFFTAMNLSDGAFETGRIVSKSTELSAQFLPASDRDIFVT